ncbi:MAG: ribonuclease HII, partial [Clostridiales bacterium]|nr:ribonuclease HII [Clostridiales bacterium]
MELKSGFVAGVDEAGRGPLAGDVFAAAVILDRDCMIEGLDDSKKLSFKKREELFEKIINNSLAYGIASATVAEIDRLNILGATVLAMNRAIKLLKVNPDFALIDGNYSKGIICD